MNADYCAAMSTVCLVISVVSLSFADDGSRCRLSFIPGVDGSDYINANFIDVSIKIYIYIYIYT